MLSKKKKKFIKNFLIKLRIWNILKRITKRDLGQPLNLNLLQEGTKFYLEFIKEGQLVFDVGANFGNRVEIFVALGAKVVAIEPQIKCARFLEKKYSTKIQIENVGLGAKMELRQLYEADNSVLSTFSTSYINKVQDSRHKSSVWEKSKFIQLLTLDYLIEKYGSPVFIKIDVEGFELEVLSGLSKKSGIISFEYTVPELLDEALKCLEQLDKIGYQYFNFSRGESMAFQNEWYSYSEFCKLIVEDNFKNTRFGDIYAK